MKGLYSLGHQLDFGYRTPVKSLMDLSSPRTSLEYYFGVETSEYYGKPSWIEKRQSSVKVT